MFFEALWNLLLVRILIALLSFSRISAHLGQHMCESTKQECSKDYQQLHMIHQAIIRATHATPLKSTCLVQSIAAKNMLKRRKISYTLYLGLGKCQDSKKQMTAHAWLRSGKTVITGTEMGNLDKYTIISTFAYKSKF